MIFSNCYYDRIFTKYKWEIMSIVEHHCLFLKWKQMQTAKVEDYVGLFLIDKASMWFITFNSLFMRTTWGYFILSTFLLKLCSTLVHSDKYARKYVEFFDKTRILKPSVTKRKLIIWVPLNWRLNPTNQWYDWMKTQVIQKY